MHAVRDRILIQGIAPDQFLDTGTDTDMEDQDDSHILSDIEVTVTIAHTEVIPHLITDITIGVLHDAITPAPIFITMIHHTEEHLHTEVPHLIPEIAAEPDQVLHINQVRKPSSNPSKTAVKPQDRKHHRVMIDDPQNRLH